MLKSKASEISPIIMDDLPKFWLPGEPDIIKSVELWLLDFLKTLASSTRYIVVLMHLRAKIDVVMLSGHYPWSKVNGYFFQRSTRKFMIREQSMPQTIALGLLTLIKQKLFNIHAYVWVMVSGLEHACMHQDPGCPSIAWNRRRVGQIINFSEQFFIECCVYLEGRHQIYFLYSQALH